MESLKFRRNKIKALDAARQMFHVARMKQMRNVYITFIGNHEVNGRVGKLWRIPHDNIKKVLRHWMKGKGWVSSGKG